MGRDKTQAEKTETKTTGTRADPDRRPGGEGDPEPRPADKMTEYIILGSSFGDGPLVEAVNSGLRNGWEPQGGICFGNNTFYQAMVKRS